MVASTLRKCFMVVNFQFERLRMLLNDHTMKTRDRRALKETVVSDVQPLNVNRPISVSVAGSLREPIREQLWYAPFPKLVSEFGSVKEVRLLQPSNAYDPTLVSVSGRIREVRRLQNLNALGPIFRIPSGTLTRRPSAFLSPSIPTTASPLILNAGRVLLMEWLVTAAAKAYVMGG